MKKQKSTRSLASWQFTRMGKGDFYNDWHWYIANRLSCFQTKKTMRDTIIGAGLLVATILLFVVISMVQ